MRVEDRENLVGQNMVLNYDSVDMYVAVKESVLLLSRHRTSKGLV